jgi:lysophospholipase L1-like esterase
MPVVQGIPLADGPRAWSRYVAVGDGLSEGLGDPVPGGRTRGWAALLAERLRERTRELSFTNLAVRGCMVRHVLVRQHQPAPALRPDLVSASSAGTVMAQTARPPDRKVTEAEAVEARLLDW